VRPSEEEAELMAMMEVLGEERLDVKMEGDQG